MYMPRAVLDSEVGSISTDGHVFTKSASGQKARQLRGLGFEVYRLGCQRRFEGFVMMLKDSEGWCAVVVVKLWVLDLCCSS